LLRRERISSTIIATSPITNLLRVPSWTRLLLPVKQALTLRVKIEFRILCRPPMPLRISDKLLREHPPLAENLALSLEASMLTSKTMMFLEKAADAASALIQMMIARADQNLMIGITWRA
jgi:hypothetical protein